VGIFPYIGLIYIICIYTSNQSVPEMAIEPMDILGSPAMVALAPSSRHLRSVAAHLPPAAAGAELHQSLCRSTSRCCSNLAKRWICCVYGEKRNIPAIDPKQGGGSKKIMYDNVDEDVNVDDDVDDDGDVVVVDDDGGESDGDDDDDDGDDEEEDDEDEDDDHVVDDDR
jgi:hypothetical protein